MTSDIIRYSQTTLPTTHGTLKMMVFRETSGLEHVAMVAGDVRGADVLCRVHSECLTSEVFGSLKCECKEQLDASLDLIAHRGRGVVIYMRGHEGRGIGLGDKIRAYALQEVGFDTVDANLALGHPVDGRDYTDAADVLRHLGANSIRLLTNNPDKTAALSSHGIAVAARVPIVIAPTPRNTVYLDTKRERMGHGLR